MSLTADLAHGQCHTYDVHVVAGERCPFFGDLAPAGFTDINEAGHAAGGSSGCGDDSGYIFVWPAQDPPIVIPLPPELPYGGFRAISNSGALAGTGQNQQGQDRAFMYQDGQFTIIEPPPEGHWSEALAVNTANEVVGFWMNQNVGPIQAYIFKNGQLTDIDLPIGPNSVANDINETGQICGWMGVSPANCLAFIWKDNRTTDFAMPGSIATEAKAINNNQLVCGVFRIPNPRGGASIRRAFLRSNDHLTDLGILPGYAYSFARDLNDNTQIVGDCTDETLVGEAFIWQNGMMSKLNDLIPQELNLNITMPQAINNAGQIAADALDQDNNQIGVILTPIASPVGDFNCDATINVLDLLGVIREWNKTISPADFNNDHNVGLPDLMVVIDNWG